MGSSTKPPNLTQVPRAAAPRTARRTPSKPGPLTTKATTRRGLLATALADVRAAASAPAPQATIKLDLLAMTPPVLLTVIRKISTGLNGNLYYPKLPTPRISPLSPLPANPAPTLVPWPGVMPLLSSIPAGNGTTALVFRTNTATNVPMRRFYRLKFLPVP